MNKLMLRLLSIVAITFTICFSFPKEATDYFGSYGAKWAFNQKSRDGITWADTTRVWAYTYNTDSNVVTVDVYQKDTNATTSIWRIVANTNFSRISNNSKKVTELTLQYNATVDTWDTTMVDYNFNENYTIASIESQTHISGNQLFVVFFKTIYWYEGTRISGDSSLLYAKYYDSGYLDLSLADTALKRFSKNIYIYTDSSYEKIYSWWDPTLQVWVESSKCISTLDKGNKPLISITTETECDTCIIMSKDSIVYTETGKIAEQVHLLLQQGIWILDNRTVYMTTNPPGFVKVNVQNRSAKRMVNRFVTETGKTKKYDLCGREINNDCKNVPSYRITRPADGKKITGAIIFK